MGMKLPKELEREILARADSVGPSMVDAPPVEAPRAKPGSLMKFVVEDGAEWTFRVPGWCPTPLNKILYGRHWTTGAKHKQSDAEIVAHYARGVPKAQQKRAVNLHVVFPPKKRMPDVDAYAKSLLDALVHCGLLVNDSAAWCVLNPVAYSRGQSLVSFITVEDI